MARNPLSAFGDAFMSVLAHIGEAARSNQMQDKFGPMWREDYDFTRASRASTLQGAELNQARTKLTLADELAGLIGDSATGWADSVPPQETVTLGTEGGGLGYASNMPSPEAVPPDFAEGVPDDLGELTGFDRDALVRLGLGKARNDKRALQELKGDQSMAAIAARATATAGRDARLAGLRERLEKIRSADRENIAMLTAEMRRDLEEFRQGRMDVRQERGIGATDRRFYDNLSSVEERWAQSQDLRALTARRQVLQAELDRDAGLSPDGRAQVIFELGVLNGRLANMGLKPSVVTPEAQPGQPGVPNSESTPVPARRPTAAPVQVQSLEQVMALPDGAEFVLNGRRFRKQGAAAVPIQ